MWNRECNSSQSEQYSVSDGEDFHIDRHEIRLTTKEAIGLIRSHLKQVKLEAGAQVGLDRRLWGKRLEKTLQVVVTKTWPVEVNGLRVHTQLLRKYINQSLNKSDLDSHCCIAALHDHRLAVHIDKTEEKRSFVWLGLVRVLPVALSVATEYASVNGLDNR